MNPSANQISEETKDVHSSEEGLDFWSRGDLEELNLWSSDSSNHVHYKLKLEDTIANQNSLIESLKEALETERSKYVNLSEELYASKEEAATEMEKLRRKIEEVVSDSNKKKIQCNEEMDQSSICRGAVVEKLDEKFESNMAVLNEEMRLKKEELEGTQSKNNEIFKQILQRSVLKESLFLKQIELLSSRIEELYERGVNHDSELEASRKIYEEELSELKEALKEMKSPNIMPEELKTLNEQLAESRTNELKLQTQLCSQKKTQEKKIENLEEKLKLYTEKLSSLEGHYEEMAAEHESHSREHSKTICNYNSTLAEMYKRMKDLFEKISLLFLFLNNSDLSGNSDNANRGPLFDDLHHNKSSDDELNEFLFKINGAIVEIDEIKEHIVGVCKDNEALYNENTNLKVNIDENNQCISSMQSEINNLNERCIETETIKCHLEEKFNDLDKVKCNLQTEINQLNIKYQQLLSDKISLERKFDKQYQNQVDNLLLPQINWKNSPLPCVENLTPTPSNETFDVNLIKRTQCANMYNMVTSTPYPPNNLNDFQGGGERINNSSTEEDYAHFSLLKWMEKCQLLNQENKKLTDEVENLKLEISELEFGNQMVKEGMDILEIKRENLEIKISDYEEKKKRLLELKEDNIRYTDEIRSLREDICTLNERNEKLHEENIKLEEKFQSYSLTDKLDEGKMDEKFINDFNEKIKEIITLKSKVMRLQENEDKLLKQIEKLKDTKNVLILKLEQTFGHLCLKEDEMEDLLREKYQAQTENKLLTKQVEILKLQIDGLKKLREKHLHLGDSSELLEHMQKDLLKLYKNAIENKLEIDQLRLEKKNILDEENLDARHRYELLLKTNGTLQSEKEYLLQKVSELQELLHEYQR